MSDLIRKSAIYEKARYRENHVAPMEIENAPTVNAVMISEGATNGDVMKAIFPNAELEVVQYGSFSDYWLKFEEADYRFHSEWWDAPYDMKRK